MNRGMTLACALAVAGGVLGGCGQQSGTGDSAAAPPSAGPTSSTAAGALATSSPAPTGPATRVIRVAVRGGQVSGDAGRVEVPLGTPVTLAVTSDVAEEIHVHGYDKKAPVAAGGTASVSFTADIPGVFEVELEESGLPLLSLQVSS